MQQQQQRPTQQQQQQQQQPKAREAEAATKVQDEFESMRTAVMSGFNQQSRDLCNVANRERDAVTMERTVELLATKTKSCAQRLVELNATKESHKAASERMEAGLQQIAASKQKCQQALKASVAFRNEARKVLDVIATSNKAVDDPTAELGAELRRVKPLVHQHTFAEWQAFTLEAERVVATLNATTATMRTTATLPDGSAAYIREVLRGEGARPSPFFRDLAPAAQAAIATASSSEGDGTALFTADVNAALALVAQGAAAVVDNADAGDAVFAPIDEAALSACALTMTDVIKELSAAGCTVPKGFVAAADGAPTNAFTEAIDLQRVYAADAAKAKDLAAELAQITAATATDDASLSNLEATKAELEREIAAAEEAAAAAKTKGADSLARLAAISTETATVQAAIDMSDLALKALNDEATRVEGEVAALDAVSAEREAAFRAEQEAVDAELAAAEAVQTELEEAIAKASAEASDAASATAANTSAQDVLVAAEAALAAWLEAHAKNAADFTADEWNGKVAELKAPLADAIEQAVAIHGGDGNTSEVDGDDGAVDVAASLTAQIAAAFEVAVASRDEAVAKITVAIARDEAAIATLQTDLQELGVTVAATTG